VQLSGTVELDPAFSRPEAVRHLAPVRALVDRGGYEDKHQQSAIAEDPLDAAERQR